MVAAAKVRRAQMKMMAARPFTQAVVSMLKRAVSEVADIDLQAHIFLRKETDQVSFVDRAVFGSWLVRWI